jgi:phytoene dehydrogenase-like protein
MTAAVEAQIERFAPGFRDRVVARHVMGTGDLERHNANYVGGDIAGGAHSGRQLLLRPVTRLDPYRVATPGNERWFLCSASTPPGAGVHGMCGLWAARAALRHL